MQIWSFYCDLEESLGTLESARRVYDGMLDLRVATPQTILNYAALLSDSKHWQAHAVSLNDADALALDLTRAVCLSFGRMHFGVALSKRRGAGGREDSFSVYERGVNAFRWPHSKDLWLAYLKEFLARYGGRKLERARDLFEQALGVFPKAACKELYLAFAKLEEDHGLARHAMVRPTPQRATMRHHAPAGVTLG